MWFLDENMMMMLVSSPSLLIQDLNIEFKLLDSRLSLCHSISWKSQAYKLIILKIVPTYERILYLPRILLCLLSNLFINIPLSLEKPTCMLVDLLPFWNASTIIYYSSNFFLIYLSLKWMDNFFPLQLLPFFCNGWTIFIDFILFILSFKFSKLKDKFSFF
jgi:hypothetical protein